MSNIEKQVQSLQKGFISVLNDIEMAIINKQYDIAHNIIRQQKKITQEDLIENEKELVK